MGIFPTDTRYRLTLLKRCSQSTRPGKIRESIDDFQLLHGLHVRLAPILEALALYHRRSGSSSPVYNDGCLLYRRFVPRFFRRPSGSRRILPEVFGAPIPRPGAPR
jgi:hypothetical protein